MWKGPRSYKYLIPQFLHVETGNSRLKTTSTYNLSQEFVSTTSLIADCRPSSSRKNNSGPLSTSRSGSTLAVAKKNLVGIVGRSYVEALVRVCNGSNGVSRAL